MLKKLFKKLLNVLNVHPDKNQRWLLASVCLSGLLITYSYPMLLKTIISQLPAEWLAFESLAMSVVALFLWSICCIIDDIGWIIVYIKEKDKLKINDDEHEKRNV